MARPKSKLTKAQKAERAREYARAYRLRQAKADGKDAPAAGAHRDALAIEIKRARSAVAARGQALLEHALDAAEKNGSTVSDAMASLRSAADDDLETTALVMLLASLQRALACKNAIAAGKFDDIVPPAKPASEPAAKTKRA